MNIINLVDKPDIQIQNMRIIAKNFLVFDTEHVPALSFYEKNCRMQKNGDFLTVKNYKNK